MKVKSLVTGKLRNVGDTFLTRQPKPVIGSDGRLYKDGEFVLATDKEVAGLGAEAAKIVDAAKKPVKEKSKQAPPVESAAVADEPVAE